MFIDAGPIRPDSTLFVGRKAELAKLLRLCQGEVRKYAIVYGGRQTGKTSLLMKLGSQLPATTAYCRVDFQGSHRASSVEAARYIAQRISEDFANHGYAVPSSTALNGSPDLRDYLRAVVSNPNLTRFVLCLEELGALPKATQEDLANVLRHIFTNRNELSFAPLNKLMVVISGSVELYDLAVIEVSTLHSVCEEIHLGDFSETDALHLVTENLELPDECDLKQADVAALIYRVVGGHPYFTQRLGNLIEEGLQEEQLDEQTLETVIDQLFATDHLLGNLQRGVESQKLVAACGDLLDQAPRFSRQDRDMVLLELLGLAKERDGAWAPRNPMLARAMRSWTREKAMLPRHYVAPSGTIPSVQTLQRLLDQRFSLEELKGLCFDLKPYVSDLDYENLPGEGKAAKARELVTHLDRREALGILLGWMRVERPDIALPLVI